MNEYLLYDQNINMNQPKPDLFVDRLRNENPSEGRQQIVFPKHEILNASELLSLVESGTM